MTVLEVACTETTIADDDKALNYNPAIVQASASNLFNEAQITAAQEVAGTFVAEEFLDSTLNNNWMNPAAVDEWWSQHSGNVLPVSQQETMDFLKKDQRASCSSTEGPQGRVTTRWRTAQAALDWLPIHHAYKDRRRH